VEQAGRLAAGHFPETAGVVRVRIGNRVEQGPGVGVLGPAQQVLGAGLFYDLRPYMTKIRSEKKRTVDKSWVM